MAFRQRFEFSHAIHLDVLMGRDEKEAAIDAYAGRLKAFMEAEGLLLGLVEERQWRRGSAVTTVTWEGVAPIFATPAEIEALNVRFSTCLGERPAGEGQR